MIGETMNGVRPAHALDDPDRPIVELIRAGHTSLYEVLIRRYNQRLYRVARAFIHDEEAIEDIMQEAYIRAFTALPRFQGRARFSTWLTRILINCALAWLRSRSRRPEVALDAVDGSMAGAASAAGVDGEQRIVNREIGRLVEEAVQLLPTPYRVVFLMREVEGMSVAETASSLQISPANTKVRLHRAKKLLREILLRSMPDIRVYAFFGERCDRLTERVMQAVHAAAAPGPAQAPGRPVLPTPRS